MLSLFFRINNKEKLLVLIIHKKSSILSEAKDLKNCWSKWVTFSGERLEYLGVVLGYFPDISYPPLETRDEATS